MSESVKVRSSRFLACFIAIATAFVLADGSGWQEKRASVRGVTERKRDFGLLLFLGKVLPITLAANPGPLGRQTVKVTKEQKWTTPAHEEEWGAVWAHADRGSLHCTRSMGINVLHKTLCRPADRSCGCEIPLKGHIFKKTGGGVDLILFVLNLHGLI